VQMPPAAELTPSARPRIQPNPAKTPMARSSRRAGVVASWEGRGACAHFPSCSWRLPPCSQERFGRSFVAMEFALGRRLLRAGAARGNAAVAHVRGAVAPGAAMPSEGAQESPGRDGEVLGRVRESVASSYAARIEYWTSAVRNDVREQRRGRREVGLVARIESRLGLRNSTRQEFLTYQPRR
jgi:hypothetical protein